MALIYILVLKPSDNLLMGSIIFFIVLGTFASHRAEILLKKRDSRHIIIDEFTGYLISIVFLKQEPIILLAAFFLFRLFDIVKPPPINYMERFVGGTGVMLDDIMAGLYANVIIQIVIRIFGR